MIVNAMTVDVEEYFHVEALANSIERSSWDSRPSRVVESTRKLLEAFDDANTRATFFILGVVAQKQPALVKEIAAAGHEIACHGQSHRLVYKQSRDEFTRESRDAKARLEDLTGCPVNGYRAASFSITAASMWALEVLADLGFTYDSSVAPVRHDLYGVPNACREAHVLKLSGNRRIVELPPATLDLGVGNLPFGGGGYFRLFPYWLTRMGLSRINSREKAPFVFYLHPWEVDPSQPRVPTRWSSRFRHYNNLDKCESRLRRMLADFQFGSMQELMTQPELPEFDVTVEAGRVRFA